MVKQHLGLRSWLLFVSQQQSKPVQDPCLEEAAVIKAEALVENSGCTRLASSNKLPGC